VHHRHPARPGRAFALQPLDEFLAGAHRFSLDNREAALNSLQQQRDLLAARGRLMPSVTARGIYTHNQYDAKVDFAIPGMTTGQSFTIQPQNQVDGTIELDVPIVDVGNYYRTRASGESLDALRHTQAATLLEVEKQVARAYFQLIGAEAVRRSAEESLVVARSNYDLTNTRPRGGRSNRPRRGTGCRGDRAHPAKHRGRRTIRSARRPIAGERSRVFLPRATFPA